ncbi:hypothetical protein K402DRAFT_457143 [Aulographum hederae CBS 113979]|uniref:Uncharacterized protein n=1 Tax=Aulographum hederae CBS 113979 TaxID=1176131 RepID=A0A6G1GNR9_9PEZI|nr:hypothetical protein K402DRAFT_457143 [Aulographum hederae CBS 113979]
MPSSSAATLRYSLPNGRGPSERMALLVLSSLRLLPSHHILFPHPARNSIQVAVCSVSSSASPASRAMLALPQMPRGLGLLWNDWLRHAINRAAVPPGPSSSGTLVDILMQRPGSTSCRAPEHSHELETWSPNSKAQ